MFYNYLNNHEIYSHACNPSHFCDYPDTVVEETTEEVVTPEEDPIEEDTVEETVEDEVTTEEEPAE